MPYTTKEALEYITKRSAERGITHNWSNPNSGYPWLHQHREAGHLKYQQINQEGRRPKYIYAKEDLDEFIEFLEKRVTGKDQEENIQEENMLYTTQDAVNYVRDRLAQLGAPVNWNHPSSGVAWLRLHREAGRLQYREERQKSRPKYSYTKDMLDEFIANFAETTRPGRPRTDFSMLTDEEKATLSTEEIARRAGVGEYTVHFARMRGDLPSLSDTAGRPRSSFSMLSDDEAMTLSDEEIAQRAGVNVDTVRRARMRGQLPYRDHGRTEN